MDEALFATDHTSPKQHSPSLELGSARTWLTAPPASEFVPCSQLPGDTAGWCIHPVTPDWLLKAQSCVYFHVPSSSLWRRHGQELVQADAYQRAVGCLAGSAPQMLLRLALAVWVQMAQEARLWQADGAEATLESPEPRPLLRTAPRGLRRSRHGISPPPASGWMDAGEGWQCHPRAPNWLRKSADSDGPVFFYLPSETLWKETRSGGFVCMSTYHSALTTLISASLGALARSCFAGWRNQACVVAAWRRRIGFMACAEEEEEVPAVAPVQSVFWQPSTDRQGETDRSRRSSSRRRAPG